MTLIICLLLYNVLFFTNFRSPGPGACKCTDSTRGEYAYDQSGRLIERLATNVLITIVDVSFFI